MRKRKNLADNYKGEYMNKQVSKALSILLSVLLLCGLFNISAIADDAPPVLKIEYSSFNKAVLKWKYNKGFADGAIIEKSTDGNEWTQVANTAKTSYKVTVEPKKAVFYHIICYKKVGSSNTKFYEGETEPVTVCASLSGICGKPYIFFDSEKKNIKLIFSYKKKYYKYTSGFDIYKKLKGGKLTYLKSVKASKHTSENDTYYYYSLKDIAPSKNAAYVKYLVVPYFKCGGIKYEFRNNKEAVEARTANKKLAEVITYQDKVVIKLKSLGGNLSNKITYTRYSRKTGKQATAVTKNTSKTTYTIKDAESKKYGYTIKVTPHLGADYNSYSALSFDSQSADALMKNPTLANKTTIPVINTRAKKSFTDWSYTLNDKDTNIIEDFFYKKYKGNNPSREVMAKYAFNWIHKNVDYDYKYLKVTNSNPESIFKNKAGQCLQYNGTMASVLAYLGYESRIIEGYRANKSGKPVINHFWCEVKINGEWYLMETGNYGKNGDWKHYCRAYTYGDGYTKNGKLVVPKAS
jgi:hypothetical protein